MKTILIWFMVFIIGQLVFKLQKFEIHLDFGKFPLKKFTPKKHHNQHQPF